MCIEPKAVNVFRLQNYFIECRIAVCIFGVRESSDMSGFSLMLGKVEYVRGKLTESMRSLFGTGRYCECKYNC